jgi:hypothetical protein
MLRKATFALIAVATMGAAALAPTAASAWGWYDGWAGYYDVWYGWAPGYFYPSSAYAESIASCARRYRTYDAPSGTFVGNDGLRHFCR